MHVKMLGWQEWSDSLSEKKRKSQSRTSRNTEMWLTFMLSYFRKVGGAPLVIAGVHKLQDHAMLAYLQYGNIESSGHQPSL
jgi:hypothetical protein